MTWLRPRIHNLFGPLLACPSDDLAVAPGRLLGSTSTLCGFLRLLDLALPTVVQEKQQPEVIPRGDRPAQWAIILTADFLAK